MCVGFDQESKRMRRDWKTKTTPMRALKRRKLVDIVGRENDGRVMKTASRSLGRGESLLELRSSMGITCCNSLLSISTLPCFGGGGALLK